jgi:hypothetical protein
MTIHYSSHISCLECIASIGPIRLATARSLQETGEYDGRMSSFRIIEELGVTPYCDNDSGIICESNPLDVEIYPEK